MGLDNVSNHANDVGLEVQKSFNRLGVPLKGRSIKIIGGVGKGYALRMVTDNYFRGGAECVLQERDPLHAGKMRVSGVFPAAPAAK